MIAIEFARFLGLPVIRRANLTDITEAVCGVCTDTRTGLVAVDFTDRHRRCPCRCPGLASWAS
jgi:hypothetical protein